MRDFGQDDEGGGGRGDDLERLQVEGVDLVANGGREGLVLNLLQASAVDVPDASLPDVS